MVICDLVMICDLVICDLVMICDLVIYLSLHLMMTIAFDSPLSVSPAAAAAVVVVDVVDW